MKIVDYDDKYAQELADMWNASDEGWPGGLTRGVPKTPDKIIESERRIKCYGRFIVMERGKAVGYVRVNPYFEEKEAAYVSWLNVLPTHHGKSYGRKLLCRSVECTLEHGLERLDLHTWPGNIKALPAYKKTGFFWVPKTTVYMQDYLPGILKFPPAKEYFEKHDWYDTFQRKIVLEEDDFQTEGMNVYPYEWKDGGDMLKVWVDRESRGITGFENKDMKVFVKLDRHDVLAGMTWRITWTIKNKTKKEISCRLKASPPKGVSLRAREKRFDIPAGKSKESSSSLRVSLGAEEIPVDEKSDFISTRMSIGGKSFLLRTGLRTKQAVQIQTDPEFISLVPGKEKSVHVNLKSNLKRKVKGILRLRATGVRLDKNQMAFSMPSEGKTGVPLTIRAPASETKSHRIEAWVEFEGGRTKKKTLRARSVDVHGAVADVEDERLVVENSRVRVVAAKKGGWMNIYDKISRDAEMEHLNMRIGPPFWPSELSRLKFSMRAKNQKGYAVGTLSTTSEERPGLAVSIEIRMSSSELIQVVPVLENRSSKSIKCEIQFAGFREMVKERVTLPSKYGLVQEEAIEDEFPDWMEDIPKTGYFSERWIHVGDNERGLGVIWGEKASEVQIGGWSMMITMLGATLGSKKRTEFEPLCLLPSTTDWKMIRRHWLQIAKGVIESDERLSPHRVLLVETRPKPLVVEDEARFELTAKNLRNKKVDARIILDAPRGLKVSRSRFRAQGLSLDSPMKEVLKVSAKKVPLGAYSAKARLTTPLYDDIYELPMIVVGKPGKVSVRDRKGTITIDNGFLKYVVVPRFAGSMVSLTRNGSEYLSSAYPEPGQLSWFRPWHGGIMPFARRDEFPGRLHNETYSHEKVRRGIWRGIRTKTRVKKYERIKGLEVSTEYLTRPKSNIVAIRQEFKNAGKSSLLFYGGCMAFYQVGGSRRTSAYFSRSGWRLRKWAKVSSFSSSDNRAIVVTDSKRKESICFVSSCRRCDVLMFDLAREGKHTLADANVSLAPGKSRVLTHYVVLAPSPTEGKKYKVLADYIDKDLA